MKVSRAKLLQHHVFIVKVDRKLSNTAELKSSIVRLCAIKPFILIRIFQLSNAYLMLAYSLLLMFGMSCSSQ